MVPLIQTPNWWIRIRERFPARPVLIWIAVLVYVYFRLVYAPLIRSTTREDPSWVTELVLLACAALPPSFMPLELSRPSRILAWLTHFLVTLPFVALADTLSTRPNWELHLYVVGVSFFYPVALLLVDQGAQWSVDLARITAPIRAETAETVLWALVILTVIAILQSGAFVWDIALDTMYERRLRARRVLQLGSLLGYLNNIFVKVLIPGLATVLIWRNWKLGFLVLIPLLVSWSFDGQRMVWGLALCVGLVFFLTRYWGRTAVTAAIVALLIFLFVAITRLGGAGGGISGDYTPAERMSVVPAILHGTYFEQFRYEPAIGFQGIRQLWGLAEMRPSLIYTFEHGLYWSSEINQANTGLIASAFAMFHWGGMVAYFVFALVVLAILDACSDEAPLWFKWMAGGYIFFQWSNAEGLSSLTTGAVVALPFAAILVSKWHQERQNLSSMASS